MKKSLQILVALSIAASSFLFATPSHAIGALYNGTNGDVACVTDGSVTGSGYFTISNNVVIRNYVSCVGSAVIPNGVTSIGVDAFAYSSGMTSLNIPNSVTSIGYGSFFGATSLTSLTIPNSVTSIGVQAFRGASALTSVSIGNSVTTIDSYAFYGANALSSLTIGNSVTSIGSAAFYNATSLTSLTIPNSVTSIGSSAFYNATSLTSLTIGNSVTSIGDYAFYGASALTSLSIPNSVTSIGFAAFYNARALTSLTIGNSVTSIGGFAFSGASALTALTIGNGVTSIGEAAFRGATSLTSLTIGNSVTSIGSAAFFGASALTTYRYCGTALTSTQLSTAGLGNLTISGCVSASISSLSFTDDGTGTGGKLVWTGRNVDSVLYTGPANSYPGPYNYGTFTSGWNGKIRNLTPETSYTISIMAISADGIGETKSLIFKTGAASSSTSQATQNSNTNLVQVLKSVEDNVFTPGEASRIAQLLKRFSAIETSKRLTYIRVPTSRVSNVQAISLTPNACSVSSMTATVDAGMVRALSGGTCTISYTVSDRSNARVTMIRDFVFKKFAK